MARTRFMLAAIGSVALASGVLAQCPRQQLFSPSEFANSFGGNLELNERHLLVGDVSEYSLCGDVFCSNGMVYAYERDGGGDWVLRQLVAPAALGPLFQFGSSMALDGDRVLISAARLTVGGPIVYEFTYDSERWNETNYMVPPEGRTFGGVIALRDDTALILDSRAEDLLVYQMEGGQWELVEELSNPDVPVGRTGFGASVLNDDWIVVGASLEDLAAINGGAAYIYRRLPDGGVEFAQKLVPPDVLEGPRFGWPMAIQGDELFIGAPLSDRDFVKQGVVHVYQLRDGQWEPTDELTHSQADDNDSFGSSISVHGDRLAIGARADITPDGGRGSVYVFIRSADGRWVQAASVYSAEPTYQFGGGRLWGDTLAVGSRDANPTGVVDIFDVSCEICKPDIDADGTLTLFDFLTFLNAFAAGDMLADFDGDGDLTLFDFLAFQTAFAVGCP